MHGTLSIDPPVRSLLASAFIFYIFIIVIAMLIFFWYCLDELDLILNDERMREDLADDTWNSYSTVQEAGRLGRFILDAEVLWEEMQISRRSSSEVEDVAEERGSLDTGVRRRSNLIAQEADRLIRLLDLSTEDEDTNSSSE